MMEFMINGKTVTGERGETILDVARREGVYIPTMCHLPKVTPIASCRLCVVEIEDVDGLILSCQTPIKKGINVTTDSEKLFKERQKIMQFYTVNHPLECGVCDKSGECDLQNRTAEFKVNQQIFNAKDQKRDIEDWGNIQYDPSLCIMCEKCVSVSSEIVGDNNLKIQYGGYSSKIRRVDENLQVSGECMAVCPVGALTSKDFKYTTNAWELKKIPSTCSHCSVGCALDYEVKHGGSGDKAAPKIYRVTNEASFDSLCDIGRFKLDIANQAKKDESQLHRAVDAFKKADVINFSSKITNEEAYILQKIKEKLGVKLVNNEAASYQNFLNGFSKTAGKSLYSGSLDEIKSSDFIIVLGTQLTHELPVVKYAVNQAVKRNKAEVIYLNPIEDPSLQSIVTKYIKYEVGAEEGVVSLLANAFVESDNTFFKDLDIGYVASESNVGEEEIDDIKSKIARKTNPVIILGKEVYGHPQAKNIAKITGMFESKSQFKAVLAPSDLNTLGVAQICDLDEAEDGYCVGYKTRGDFRLTDEKEPTGDYLSVPSLVSQEGTIVNLDKKVVPLNVALEFEGYSLAHIANELGIKVNYTAELTKKLPKEKGFRGFDFDDLVNYYNYSGEQFRGYNLNIIESETDEKLDSVSDISEFNGSVLRPLEQFSTKGFEEQRETMIFASEQFVNAFKLSDGKRVLLSGLDIIATINLEHNLKGTIGFLTTSALDIEKRSRVNENPYLQVKLERVGQ